MSDKPHYILSSLFRYVRKGNYDIPDYDLTDDEWNEVDTLFRWIEINSEQVYNMLKDAMEADIIENQHYWNWYKSVRKKGARGFRLRYGSPLREKYDTPHTVKDIYELLLSGGFVEEGQQVGNVVAVQHLDALLEDNQITQEMYDKCIGNYQ